MPISMSQTDVKPVASITGIRTRGWHRVMLAMARDKRNVPQPHADLGTANGMHPPLGAVGVGVYLTERAQTVPPELTSAKKSIAT